MGLPSRCAKVLQSHAGAILVAKLDKNGEYCMSGGSDKLIKLWSPFREYTRPIQEYSGHSWDVSDLAISPDNTTFASVGGDRVCFYWDVSSGRIIRKFQGHHQRLSAVAMNELGNVVATGSNDKTVRLWDCRAHSRFPLQILEDAKDSIGAIQIHDAEILVGSIDGYARIYDIRNGRIVTDPVGDAITSVAYSVDGKCYLAGCLDSTIRLVDRSDGSILNKYTGHQNTEYRISCAFSNTDEHVLSGSEDGKIWCWGFVSGEKEKVLEGHKGVVSSLAYHPKEDALLSASFDGTIRIWL